MERDTPPTVEEAKTTVKEFIALVDEARYHPTYTLYNIIEGEYPYLIPSSSLNEERFILDVAAKIEPWFRNFADAVELLLRDE